MVKKEIRIDENNLDKSAISIPILHSKYLQLLHESQMKCVKLKAEYDQIYRTKYIYYRNDHNIIFKSKSEIEVMVDGDGEVQEKRMKLEYEKSKAEYLESVIKMIGGLSFLIRDAIEWKKFQAGM